MYKIKFDEDIAPAGTPRLFWALQCEIYKDKLYTIKDSKGMRYRNIDVTGKHNKSLWEDTDSFNNLLELSSYSISGEILEYVETFDSKEEVESYFDKLKVLGELEQ